VAGTFRASNHGSTGCRQGVLLPNFGDCGDVRTLIDIAADAESAGWDGLFLWDHISLWPTPIVDPWIALGALALLTERLRLGTIVTPLPRRHPIKLARESLTLDHLSRGRVTLGVGIGDGAGEWEHLGGEPDPRTRAAMLDEGLGLLAALWSGEPVQHHGRFYRYAGETPGAPERPTAAPFLPRPIQRPRIPIWVAGVWPRRAGFRRAARWDGAVPRVQSGAFSRAPTAAELSEIVTFLRAERDDGQPFDICTSGRTSGSDRAADTRLVGAHVDAGATWWLEDISPWAFGWRWAGPWPFEAMRERVRRGPSYLA
jgi:alkanesulfonate monooxygenase SsuD/methylene tetrahydromethanopterin reductase-like flavin-dependent oxidoreductase (luciferase family)